LILMELDAHGAVDGVVRDAVPREVRLPRK
jgi:hypothetical protein